MCWIVRVVVDGPVCGGWSGLLWMVRFVLDSQGCGRWSGLWRMARFVVDSQICDGWSGLWLIQRTYHQPEHVLLVPVLGENGEDDRKGTDCLQSSHSATCSPCGKIGEGRSPSLRTLQELETFQAELHAVTGLIS